MLVALYSPKGSYDNTFLANYAYINILDQLTRIPGHRERHGIRRRPVRDEVLGQARPARQAQHHRWRHHPCVQSQNTVNPAGLVGAEPAPKGQDFTYSVRVQGRLGSPEEFGAIVIRANPDGSAVRLRDVARVELGAQTYNLVGRLNGKPAANIAIYQLPGSNALDCANGVKAAMARIKLRFPQDLDYEIALDTTQAVSEGMREISNTLWQALLLVVLVVFVFLQGWRPTLIPMLAVPVSLVGTFILFPVFGFS
jgi:HAE1 family hydrophobic/amphiphilic exporter-1